MSCWLISAWLIGSPSDPVADVWLRDDPSYGDASSVIGMQVSGIDEGPCGTRGDSMFGTQLPCQLCWPDGPLIPLPGI